jgi:hypothetical protein
MATSGMDQKTVAEKLGHADVDLTLRRHVTPSADRDGAPRRASRRSWQSDPEPNLKPVAVSVAVNQPSIGGSGDEKR